MITFRVRSGLVFGLLAFLVSPASAQNGTGGRDASFLPAPGSAPESITSSPDAASAATSGVPAGQPVPLVPALNPAAANPLANTTAAPVLSLPSAAPLPASASIVGKPVESGKLEGIDPDSIGLLSPEGGGFGAAMWKGTPRELVERLLPELVLPTASPVLNSLAQRLLLTTANVPEGDAGGGSSLTSMRIDKLIALGDAADAWNLAQLAKPGRVDEITLRLAAEAALVSGESKDVCARLPGIIQSNSSPEWQKSLVTCQLRAGNTDAAQLGLEVLHAQNVKDDAFFELAERDIIGGAKSLPRQLTPLKPLTLALLHLAGYPLPSEVYAHPEAAVIPELLQARARDDNARLALAERAAARGIVSAAQLADVYRSISFTPEQLAAAPGDAETGARQRALLFQAALTEKTPQKRIDEAEKFMQGLDAAALNGAASQVLAGMIGDVPADGAYAASAPAVAYIFIMAGKPKEAFAWLKLARQSAAGAPAIAAQLQNFWPLVVLSGMETDGDYGQIFGVWLDAALKDADRDQRARVGGMLLLLDAAGFAVPEKAWARVIEAPAGRRRTLPPSAILLERLRVAGAANRRGETVLLALAAAEADENEFSPLTAVETVRALRLAGFTADALAFAREATSLLLAPPATETRP